jgi:hypothetical protein
MGFRMVYELSHLNDKKFCSIFSIRGGGPLPKKCKVFQELVVVVVEIAVNEISH